MKNTRKTQKIQNEKKQFVESCIASDLLSASEKRRMHACERVGSRRRRQTFVSVCMPTPIARSCVQLL